LILKNEGL